MITFSEFLSNSILIKQATSNMKLLQVPKKIALHNRKGIYMRDDVFSTSSVRIKLHPSEGTHWVRYIGKNYFDSYGCAPPKNILNYRKSKHDKYVYSEDQFQKKIVFVVVIVYKFCVVCFFFRWISKQLR